LRSMSLKRFFKREKKSVMWLQIPTDLSTLAEREEFMEAILDKLEKTIYKTI
jgi:hypothetical protein